MSFKSARKKQGAGGEYDSMPRSPLYSSGTNEMDANETDSNSGASNAKNNMGVVEGPEGGKSVPDPIGYLN